VFPGALRNARHVYITSNDGDQFNPQLWPEDRGAIFAVQNAIPRWDKLTQQAIRRGTFRSVKELVEKIDHYVQNSNRQAQPFVWTATADSIFAKVERLCERISGTAH
jgi:hypothetical protein